MEDNSYLLSLQQVYEYRMALIEMEQFYGDKDKTKIFEKKGELQQKLEELVMTINEKTLSLPQFSEIYERKI